MDEKTIARFWSRVDKDGPIPEHAPELGHCWTWKGALDKGYGRIRIRGHGKPHNERAHRVGFFLEYGRWPEPCGCHKCDNRACVRGAHVFAGTRAENSLDMYAKGRSRKRSIRGEAHVNAKLTTADVLAIRAAYAAGESQRSIAERFGVTQWPVSAIVRRQRWAHVP